MERALSGGMEMDHYQSFLNKMDGIYSKFPGRLEELRRLGTQPESMVLRREGCYAVAFGHGASISGLLASHSEAVGQAVPAMVYQAEKIQTTVTPFALVDNFVGNPQDQAVAILRRAVEYALEDVPAQVLGSRQIQFRGWFYSRGIVMAPGWPNKEQFQTVQAILAGCQRMGFQPRGPWGSHCMVNRFLTAVSPEGCQDLYRLIDEAPVLDVCSQAPTLSVLDNTILPNGQFECSMHNTWHL